MQSSRFANQVGLSGSSGNSNLVLPPMDIGFSIA